MASVKRFPSFQFPKMWNAANNAKRNPSRIAFLKGPKHEIFGFGVFAQIRPIWIGDFVFGYRSNQLPRLIE